MREPQQLENLTSSNQIKQVKDKMNQSVIDRSLSLNLQQNKLKLAQISIKLQASQPNFLRKQIQSMNINIFWQSLLAQLQLYSCHLLNKQKGISSLINLKLTLTILKDILILCNNDFFQNITLMQAKSIFKNDFTQQQLNVKNAKVPINFEIPLYFTFKEYYQNSSQISRLLDGENKMDIKQWIICGTNQGTQGLANLIIIHYPLFIEQYNKLLIYLKLIIQINQISNDKNSFSFLIYEKFSQLISFTNIVVVDQFNYQFNIEYYILIIPQQKFITPEKLVRVSGSSGVKINSIQKNGTRIRSEAIETVNKVKEQQKLQEYVQELEYKFVQQKNEEQQQLELRILMLLQKNHDQAQEMEELKQENEQLKQLLYK